MVRASSIRATVFAGAGASCFAGIPAVRSFLRCVSWGEPRGFEAACQQLAKMISRDEGTKENQTWPDFDAEKLFGWLETLEKIDRIDNSGARIRVPNLRPPEILMAPVISHLRREIVRIYGSAFKPESLSVAPHRSLFKLLDSFTAQTEPLYVFTTNYDRLLEELFESWSTSEEVFREKLHICNGFSKGRLGQWQPELFSEKPRSGERLIYLVKLHGSVTWKRGDSSQVVETGWGMPTDYDCLLYFGYKGVPEEEPFLTLHTLLKETLLRCEAVIAIGFRFADPYIRELFDFALRANSNLRVICCLTRPPEPNSPLSQMMERYPRRVVLLADSTGNAIRFGHESFLDSLAQELKWFSGDKETDAF